MRPQSEIRGRTSLLKAELRSPNVGALVIRIVGVWGFLSTYIFSCIMYPQALFELLRVSGEMHRDYKGRVLLTIQTSVTGSGCVGV